VPLSHAGQERADDLQRREYVGLECRPPLFGGHFLESARRRTAGVGDDDRGLAQTGHVRNEPPPVRLGA
jgi:hypothetical protein